MKCFHSSRLLLICLLALACSLNCKSEQIGRNSYREVILHYTISAGITFVSCRLLSFNTSPELSLTKKYLISAGIGLVAGFGKEIVDLKYLTGIFDWVDIGFDVLGIGTGLLLHYYIFDKKKCSSSISLNFTGNNYIATIRINF
jgi:hypothetical protein